MPSSDVDNRNNANRPVTGSLHPRVYTVLIGLALWMALWAWSFVGGGGTDYILFIVTGFIVVVVALQLVLLRVRRADKPVDAGNGADDSTDGARSFQQWARGEFEAERGRLRAVEAALLILLPIAAAAIGMMAFGIEFQIVEHVLM